MMAAISLDGLISIGESSPVTFTSREDKALLRDKIQEADCLLLGRKTYELSRSILGKRPCIVFSRSASYSDLNDSVINNLHNYGQKFLLLGGSQIYHWFLNRGLVDELYLTVEPIVLAQGVPLLSDSCRISNLQLISVKAINDQGTLFLHYLASKQSLQGRLTTGPV